MATLTVDRGLGILILFGGIAVLVAGIYWTSFSDMWALWQRTDHQHGMLVFPISAFLLWRMRHSLSRIPLKPWVWGIAVVGVLVFLWALSRAVDVRVTEQLAAVLLIPACVLTLIGKAAFRHALFPLLLLVLAVPFGDILTPALMRITANLSSGLLYLFGIPVFREGQFMTLPGGRFEVADVCAGLRYLMSGTIVALLFSYIAFSSFWKRLAFVVITGVLLILLNGFRAFVVMAVASSTNMRVLGGEDHVYFGWLLFAVFIFILFWFGTRFSEAGQRGEADTATESDPVINRMQYLPLILALGFLMLVTTARTLRADIGPLWIVLVPIGLMLLGVAMWAGARAQYRNDTTLTPRGRRNSVFEIRSLITVVAVGIVLLSGPFVLAGPAGSRDTSPARVELQPPEIAGCERVLSWALPWAPVLHSPDFGLDVTYVCSGNPVSVFVAGYLEETQGRELVGENSEVLPANRGRYTREMRSSVDLGSDRTLSISEVRLVDDGRDSVIWYWYAVRLRTTTSPALVKLLQAYERFVGGSSGGAVVLIETPVNLSIEDSRGRLALAAGVLDEQIRSLHELTNGSDR